MMSDFDSALQAKLARNAELEREREETRRDWERFQEEQAAEEQAREQRLREERAHRHGELVEALSRAARGLKDASPEAFVVRLGWTETRSEFIAKISTRLLEPSRSLLIELDREDDEVLARWHSDVGGSLELWRLLEVEPPLIQELVLQVADQELWAGRRRPPPFPGARDLGPSR